MNITPTIAVELLFGLPPLHIITEVTAFAGIHRLYCNELNKPRVSGYRHIKVTWNTNKEAILVKGADKIMQNTHFTNQIRDHSECKCWSQMGQKKRLVL